MGIDAACRLRSLACRVTDLGNDWTADASLPSLQLQPADPRSPTTVDKNVFGPCSRIGRALGLEVDLPDLTDRAQTAALWQAPSGTWKDSFEGRVADTMRNGDRGWLRLVNYSFATAFFDLEEGVKFHTDVANVTESLRFIASLTTKGVRLWDHDFMQDHGGESGACVIVTQAVAGPFPDPGPILEGVGLVPAGPGGLSPWMMPPGWA